MQVQIQFSIDNEFFQDGDNYDAGAIADVIESVAKQIRNYPAPVEHDTIRIKDGNGNRVGFAVIQEGE